MRRIRRSTGYGLVDFPASAGILKMAVRLRLGGS
jgi:hypothetical protein